MPLVPLQADSARAVRAAHAARPARVRPVGERSARRRSRRAISTTISSRRRRTTKPTSGSISPRPFRRSRSGRCAETGRNARFADIVGPCDLRTSVAPAHLVVGQPALLTVHLDNLAFARHITGLPSAAFAGLRPEFQLSAEPIRETATDHARSFTHILRPLRAGIARIPAIVIQTFDPDSGEYQTLRSAPDPDHRRAGPGRRLPRRRAPDWTPNRRSR